MSQQIIFPTVLVSGLLDSLNPCAISVALLFIALMFTLEKGRFLILRIGFFYIISIYLTYFLIGLGILETFNLFGIPNLIARIGAFIVILFGILNLKEYFFPNLPPRIRMSIKARQKISEWAHRVSIPATIIVGFLVGIFEFPCSGSVYFAILGLLSSKVTFFAGVSYLLIYNLMFVLPLILIFLISTNRLVTEKMINWQERNGRKMHLILAFLMISLGGLLIVLD